MRRADFLGLEIITIDGAEYFVIYETVDALLAPTGNLVLIRAVDVDGGADNVPAIFTKRP